MNYEFYCDPGNSCDSDVQFWYRLLPSEGGRVTAAIMSKNKVLCHLNVIDVYTIVNIPHILYGDKVQAGRGRILLLLS